MEPSENSAQRQVEKIKKHIEKYDLSPDYIMKFSSLEHNKPSWLDTEKIKIYREEIDALKKKYNFGFFKWAGLQTAIQLYYPIDISNITNFFPNYEFSDEEKIELEAIAAENKVIEEEQKITQELENKKNASTKGIEIKNSYSPIVNSAPTQSGRDALRSLELHLKKMSGVNLTEEEIAERECLKNKMSEKDLDDPVSYLNSEFDGNINDIPFIEIFIKNYESGNYSVRKTELDEFITNTKKLIKIRKTTDIPNSLFQGVFIAMFEDNSPYVSIRFDGFDDFLRGLEKFGYEKWWKYQTRKFLGYTKDELITLSGEPDHKIEKVSRGKKREEFYYGRYRNRLGNDSYTFRIVLIDGKVDGWNDIEK